MQLQVGIRRVIGRYDRGYNVPDLFAVGVAVCCQDFQLSEEFLYVHFDGFADVDEVVWSFLHAFLGHQLFFVELFAWAEAGVGDFDVYIRGVARKLDQVSGKGVDLYRGSHVQDEDLAAFGVGSCLEDKAYGLRDSHKVADDVRMCDGDRAAFFDLALEQRDHASVAAQNVSESYSYEFCAVPAFDVWFSLTYAWPSLS